jgi:hypothetical protein
MVMGGVGGVLTIRIESFDFGRTVTIEVPPEAEVTDMTDLFDFDLPIGT